MWSGIQSRWLERWDGDARARIFFDDCVRSKTNLRKNTLLQCWWPSLCSLNALIGNSYADIFRDCFQIIPKFSSLLEKLYPGGRLYYSGCFRRNRSRSGFVYRLIDWLIEGFSGSFCWNWLTNKFGFLFWYLQSVESSRVAQRLASVSSSTTSSAATASPSSAAANVVRTGNLISFKEEEPPEDELLALNSDMVAKTKPNTHHRPANGLERPTSLNEDGRSRINSNGFPAPETKIVRSV